jgi:hypothetical protein
MENFYRREYDYLSFSHLSRPTNKEKITIKQALNDLNCFMYLCITSCASFNLFFQKNEAVIYNRYKNIKKQLSSYKEDIPISNFLDLLVKIGSGIKDMHTTIRFPHENFGKSCYFEESWKVRCTKEIFYRRGDIFFSTGEKKIFLSGVVPDQETDFDENKLYMIPVIFEGKEKFHAARFFKDKKEPAYIQIPSGDKIPLFRIKWDWGQIKKYKAEFNNKQVSYWEFPDAKNGIKNYTLQMNEFYTDIEQTRNKKVLFIENRYNQGGVPYYQIKLILNLFGIKDDDQGETESLKNNSEDSVLEGSVIMSSAVAQSSLAMMKNHMYTPETEKALIAFWKRKLTKIDGGKYEWHLENGRNNPFWYYNYELIKNSEFDGTIIITIDKNTSSQGELIYNFIKNELGYKKIFLLGTNSFGCVSFGNVNWFSLPNSDLLLGLSSATDVDQNQSDFLLNKVECRGYIPDLWATTEDEYYEALIYLSKMEK